MKRYLLCTLALVGTVCLAHAQRDGDEDIPDSVIGWSVKNKYDHFKPQTDPVAKKKEVVVNDIVRWMRASYTPVGGMGTSQRYIGKINYGVVFDVWNVTHDKRWTEPNGEFKPIPEECTHFYLTTNQIFGSWPIDFINTGNEWYFTLQPDGYAQQDQFYKLREGSDPRIHPNCYPFITYRNDMTAVYLAPNNKLPWTPVSQREFLDKAEAGLAKVLDDKRKEVATQWPDNKKAQDEVIADFMKELDKYRNIIRTTRSKHIATLDQQAVVGSWQVSIYNFNMDPDIFKTDQINVNLKHAFPVYKLDAGTYAKLGDVQPQWVSIAWPFENKERGNQLFELYTAMSQNINYQYIYDYFYAPEKVKGVSYTPSNADGLKERLAAVRARRNRNETKVAAKQAVLKDGLLLYDDFSQEGVGTNPAGWLFNNRGQANVVSTAPGEKGQWLKLGYVNAISPKTVKTLPEDFSLEFDLVTGTFDSRWGADIVVELFARKDKALSSFRFEIGAGLQSSLDEGHDYRGVMRLSLINTPSTMPYNDIGGFYESPQPEFTSSKRKVHVKILKKGDRFVISLNGKEYANSAKFKTRYGNKDCGDCSIGAGMKFEGLKIQSMTQDAANIGCYVGNIKIAKE